MHAAKYSMPKASASLEKRNKVSITIVGILLSAAIFGLFFSAFRAAPNAEIVSNCDDASAAYSEASSATITFAMGWLVCYIAMHRRCLAHTTGNAVFCCSTFAYSSYSSLTLWVSSLDRRRRVAAAWTLYEIRRNYCIIFVSILCLVCITGLFASAFSEASLADQESGDNFPSESSPAMKAFTAGWIFVLSLKLRHELTGQLGSSCLLQPF
jgi:hypothetical protein